MSKEETCEFRMPITYDDAKEQYFLQPRLGSACHNDHLEKDHKATRIKSTAPDPDERKLAHDATQVNASVGGTREAQREEG
jgi:hypothetical protein